MVAVWDLCWLTLLQALTFAKGRAAGSVFGGGCSSGKGALNHRTCNKSTFWKPSVSPTWASFIITLP